MRRRHLTNRSRAISGLRIATLVVSATLPGFPARSNSSEPPASCQRRLADLKARFRQADAPSDGASLLPVSEQFEPPRADSGAVPAGVSVLIQRGLSETLVDGQKVEVARGVPEAAAIAQQIDAGQKSWSLLHGGAHPPPPKLGVWLDRRTKARPAVSFLTDLGKQYDLGLLAAGSASNARRSPPTARVSKELARVRSTTDPALKFKMVADLFGAALAGCAGHQQFFDDPASRDPDREERFHAAIIASLTACSCAGADLDLIEALAVDDTPPILHFLPARFRDDAPQAVGLSETATVQDLVEALASHPGALVVRWTGTPSSRTIRRD